MKYLHIVLLTDVLKKGKIPCEAKENNFRALPYLVKVLEAIEILYRKEIKVFFFSGYKNWRKTPMIHYRPINPVFREGKIF
jgi:hypothetical protein